MRLKAIISDIHCHCQSALLSPAFPSLDRKMKQTGAKSDMNDYRMAEYIAASCNRVLPEKLNSTGTKQ